MFKDGRAACDVCDKPAIDPNDYWKFCINAEIDGQKGKIKIPMLAAKSDPTTPVILAACPACKDKVKLCLKKKDPAILPPSRLRRILERIKQKELMKRMNLI